MGTGKGIAIGIGIALAAILAFVVYSNGGVSALKELKPIDMTKSFTKEPIATYNNCATEMLTDKGRPMQNAKVTCYNDNVKWSLLDRPLTGIASFHFAAPTQLVDSGLTCFACKSKVYKYGDNDFQLGLFDEVGEKKYDVRLWELPQ
jgi:hypothetical protein